MKCIQSKTDSSKSIDFNALDQISNFVDQIRHESGVSRIRTDGDTWNVVEHRSPLEAKDKAEEARRQTNADRMLIKAEQFKSTICTA